MCWSVKYVSTSLIDHLTSKHKFLGFKGKRREVLLIGIVSEKQQMQQEPTKCVLSVVNNYSSGFGNLWQNGTSTSNRNLKWGAENVLGKRYTTRDKKTKTKQHYLFKQKKRKRESTVNTFLQGNEDSRVLIVVCFFFRFWLTGMCRALMWSFQEHRSWVFLIFMALFRHRKYM